MDAHRVHILDRADDDAVVGGVAHHLHLEFLPSEDGFLDQHLADRRQPQAVTYNFLEFGTVVGHPATFAAKGKGRADDRRQSDRVERLERVVEIVHRAGAGAMQADLFHRHAEQLAVLGLFDGIGARTDHFDAEFFERAVLVQRQRGVQRGLAAHGRQQRVGALGLDDACDSGRCDWLDIGGVRHLRIGHDGRRVRVDQDHPVPLRLQRLAGLCSGIVELAGLTDDDRAGADDEDGADVVAARHPYPFRSSMSAVKRSNR